MELLILVNALVCTIVAVILAVFAILGFFLGTFKYKAMRKRLAVQATLTSVTPFKNVSYTMTHPLKGGISRTTKKLFFSFLYKAGDTLTVRVSSKNPFGEIDKWHSNGVGIIIASACIALLSLAGFLAAIFVW